MRLQARRLRLGLICLVVVALVVGSGGLVAGGAEPSGALTTVGIVPPNVPGRNFPPVFEELGNNVGNVLVPCGEVPEANLPLGWEAPCISDELASLAQARSAEGLSPLLLPSNWSTLNSSEQQFVILNLERTTRGLPAFTGESSLLSEEAIQTALANVDHDPSLPSISQLESWFGANADVSDWAGNAGPASAIGEVFDWLYDDGCGIGPSGGPSGANTDCNPTISYTQLPSWGHRGNVLSDSSETSGLCQQGDCWVGVGIGGIDDGYSALEVISPVIPGGNVNVATPTPTFVASIELTWAQELPFIPSCEATPADDTCVVGTSASVSSSDSQPSPGQSVTLTATLSSSGGIPEGGSVSFFDGSSPIANCQNLSVQNPGYDQPPGILTTNPYGPPYIVTVTQPQISCVTSFSTRGPNEITASYSGSSLNNVAVYGPSTSASVTVTLPNVGTPDVPTSVMASIGNGSANLSWVAPASSGTSPISSYLITASPGSLTQSVPGSKTSASFSGLVNGTAYSFVVQAINASGSSAPSVPSNTVTPSASYYINGYWLLDSYGVVTGFGGGASLGGIGSSNSGAVGIDSTNSGQGLVEVDRVGNVATIGVVSPLGGTGSSSSPLWSPVVSIASTADSQGYWLVTSDGQIQANGDAVNYGSPYSSGLHLAAPIVSMAATPDSKGYWLVGSDGGVFAYGDAQFYGSTGALRLNAPIVSMAATPDGKGYWFVASDGGVFSYGDAQFYGSMGAKHLDKPIVAMASVPGGKGYWLFGSDGGVFAFGDAPFYGAGTPSPGSTIVAATAANTSGIE